jgi:hypothetical protein
MNLLTQLLIRIAGGEKIRKAESKDYRLWFGLLALFPLFVATFVFFPFGKRIIDQGSIGAVWACMAIGGVLFWTILQLWMKWIPAMVSLALAIVAWVAGFWIAFSHV